MPIGASANANSAKQARLNHIIYKFEKPRFLKTRASYSGFWVPTRIFLPFFSTSCRPWFPLML